jgi:hypothetical protein
MARHLIPAAYVNFDKTAGTVSFKGHHSEEKVLLITDVTAAKTLYQFNSQNYKGQWSFSETTERTTINLDYDTANDADIISSDTVQVFVNKDAETVSVSEDLLDAVGKIRVSNPGNLIDTDFEYGLQSTKWETLQSVNNIPTVYSSNGDKPIDGITTVDAVAGSKQVKVTTSVPHGLELGLPVSVQGLDDYQAEGFFTISGVDGQNTFFFELDVPASTTGDISGGYTTIVPAKFFEGSPLPVSVIDGAQTDGGSPSKIDVVTSETHGFAIGTKVYLRNTIGPKALVISDPAATSPDGRPYLDTQANFIQNFDIAGSVATGRGNVRQNTVVTWDHQPTFSLYLQSNSISDIDNTVTWPSHDLPNKSALLFNSPVKGASDGGLVDGTVYFAEVIDADTIKLHTDVTLGSSVNLTEVTGDKGSARLGLVYKAWKSWSRNDQIYTEYNASYENSSYYNTTYSTADEGVGGPASPVTANQYKTTSVHLRGNMNGEAQNRLNVSEAFGGWTGYLDGLIAGGARIFLDYMGEAGGDLEASNEFTTVTIYDPSGNGTITFGTGPTNPEVDGVDSESATELFGIRDVTDALLRNDTTYGSTGQIRYDLNESSTLISSGYGSFYFRMELTDAQKELFKAVEYENSGADLALYPGGLGRGGVVPSRVLCFQGKSDGATGGAGDIAKDIFSSRADMQNSRFGVIKPVRSNVLRTGSKGQYGTQEVFCDGSFRHNFDMGTALDEFSYYTNNNDRSGIAQNNSDVYYMFVADLNADRNTVYKQNHGIAGGQEATVIVDATDYANGQRFKFADSAGVEQTINSDNFSATLAVVSEDTFRITLNISPNTDDITAFPDNFSVQYNVENDLYNTIYVNNHKIISQSEAKYLASGNNEPALSEYTASVVGDVEGGAFIANGEYLGENEQNPTTKSFVGQDYSLVLSTTISNTERPTLWEWDAAAQEWNSYAGFTLVNHGAIDSTYTFTMQGHNMYFAFEAPAVTGEVGVGTGDPSVAGTDTNYIKFESNIVATSIGGLVNTTTYNLNRVNDSRLSLSQVVDTTASATTDIVGRASNATVTEFVNFETPLGITPTGASIVDVQYRGDFNETREYVKIKFTGDNTEYFIGRTGGADTTTFRDDSQWTQKDCSALLVDNGGFLGVNVEFDPTSRINRRIGSMTNWWEIRFVVSGQTGTVVLDSTGVVGEQEFLVDSLRGAYDGVFAIIEDTPQPNEFILATDFKVPARVFEFTSIEVDSQTGEIDFGFEHNLVTGEVITYTPDGTSMLTDETDNVFNVISTSANTIKLAVSADSAINNISTAMTAETGTHSIKARSLIKAITGAGLITFEDGNIEITGSGTSFLNTFKRFDKIYVQGADYIYALTVRDIQTNEKMRVFDAPEETTTIASPYFFITQIMLRPDGYSLHKSFDGGVDITAGTSPDSKIVRQSRKYFRYQSGKGIQNSLAINFNPPRVLRSLIKSETDTATVNTQEQHNLKVGDSVTIAGAETGPLANNPYNGTFLVSATPSPFQFSYQMAEVPDEAKASGFPTYVRNGWQDSYVRAGMFDDQNGFFFEYDGSELAVVVRSSTLQLAGSVIATRNSQVIQGSDTSFTTQVTKGDKVVIRGQSYKIVEVSSDLRMVVQPAYRGITSKGIKVTKTVDRRVPQSEWNIDTANGNGPSGFKLDTTKLHMCYADYSWYGAGKVRFGFKNREGHIRYMHEFVHNNRLGESYFRSGNLPGRYEIENGPAATTAPTLFHFGTSIIMDGRFDDDKAYLFSRNSKPFAFTNGASRTFASNAVSTFDVITLNGSRVFVYGIPCTEANATATVVGSQITVSGSTVLPEGTYVTQVKLDGATSKVFTSYPATNTEPDTANIASASTLVNGEVTPIELDRPIPLVSLRLSPSVDSALTGAVGEREIINRMQLRLRQAGITTSKDVEIFLILNAIPSKGDFQSAESPSLSQIINHDHGDTLDGGVTIYSVKGSSGSIDIPLDELLELGNSILGGDGIFPNGPDLLTVAVQPQSTSDVSGTNPFFVTGKISWSESQA